MDDFTRLLIASGLALIAIILCGWRLMVLSDESEVKHVGFWFGRYGVVFGPKSYLWFQTHKPTKVRHFLWFWFLKEFKPTDIDKKQEFPTGTPMTYEGRKYHYYKVNEDINVDKGVNQCQKSHHITT